MIFSFLNRVNELAIRDLDIESFENIIKYDISSDTVKSSNDREIFYGSIGKGFLNLTKKRTVFRFGKDLSYQITGVYKENGELSKNLMIEYKINMAQVKLKYFVSCIIPAIILFWFFSPYDYIYWFIPIIYLIATDLIFNLKNLFHKATANEHFLLYSKSITNKIPNF